MRVLPSLLYRASKLWWRLTRPITVGVRIFLVQDNRVLLVRHTYQNAWTRYEYTRHLDCTHCTEIPQQA